jgi:hypothetical protein
MPFNFETLIGTGFVLFGLGVAAYLGALGWLQVKRFEREGERPAVPRSDSDMARRLARIEQAVEVTALEVERIAESQRYLTRTLGEQGVLPSKTSSASGDKRNTTPH